MVAALAVTVVACGLNHALGARFDPTLAIAHGVLVLVLVVGLRSALGYVAVHARKRHICPSEIK